MFPPFLFLQPPLLSFYSFSSEKGTDKQAMNGIVMCSAGQEGEVNKSTLQGLSTGARQNGIGLAEGSSTHAEGGLVRDLCE